MATLKPIRLCGATRRTKGAASTDFRGVSSRRACTTPVAAAPGRPERGGSASALGPLWDLWIGNLRVLPPAVDDLDRFTVLAIDALGLAEDHGVSDCYSCGDPRKCQIVNHHPTMTLSKHLYKIPSCFNGFAVTPVFCGASSRRS